MKEINAQIDAVNEQIAQLQQRQLETSGDIIEGTDARTGTHLGDPKIVAARIAAEEQREKIAGQIKMLVIGGVAVVGLVAVLNMSKKKPQAKAKK